MGKVPNGHLSIRYRSSSMKTKQMNAKSLQTTFSCYSICWIHSTRWDCNKFAGNCVCLEVWPDCFSACVMFSVSIFLLDPTYNVRWTFAHTVNVEAFSRPTAGPHYWSWRRPRENSNIDEESVQMIPKWYNRSNEHINTENIKQALKRSGLKQNCWQNSLCGERPWLHKAYLQVVIRVSGVK